LEAVNHFAAEMDHFSTCLLTGDVPRTPGEKGLADMRIMAAIHESVRTGKTMHISRR
jgi:predicted dehydrogenase